MHAAMFPAGNDRSPNFQPSQMVLLEHNTTRLYAEVVQFLETRQLCWVRPLALVTLKASDAIDWTNYNQLRIQDLRQGSDLMCPAVLFQAALDLEVIPLLTYLQIEAEKSRGLTAHQALHQFIQQIWQTHPEVFSSRSSSTK